MNRLAGAKFVYIIPVTESDKLCIFPRVSAGGKFGQKHILTGAQGDFAPWRISGKILKKGLISWGKYGIICFCIKGILCPEEFFEQEV